MNRRLAFLIFLEIVRISRFRFTSRFRGSSGALFGLRNT